MKKSLIKSLFFILLLILWIYLFSQINTDKFIELIGVGNIYIFFFFLALFAGVSIFTSSSYIGAIISLSSSPEINVFLLAITGGIALTLADGIFYYFGKKSRDNLPDILDEKLDKITKWIREKPEKYIQIFIYFYIGFTPLPADIVLLSLSFAKYPFKKAFFPFLLGNITLIFVIFYLAKYGYETIINSLPI